MNLLDDAVHSNCINLSCLHYLKSTISIIFIVTWAAQSCSDSSVDVAVVGQQAFLRGMVEICAVVDAGDFAGRATEDLGLPSIKM